MQTLLNFLKLISATKEKSDFGSFVDNLGSFFVYFVCILTEFFCFPSNSKNMIRNVY